MIERVLIGLAAMIVLLLGGRMAADRFFGKKSSSSVEEPHELPKAEEVHLGAEWDYRSYTLSRGEYATAIIAAGLAASLFGYLFYRSIWVSALFFLAGFLYPPHRAARVAEKRRDELSAQFKQALYSLSSLLSAGQSVENAFRGICRDLLLIYPNPETPIIREMERIVRRMEHGITIEEALSDFGTRSGVEDIMNFANVFSISKRTGGNLVEVVRRSTQIIAEKIEVKQEIAVLLAQKKFESRVLGSAPLAIVAFLSLASPDYMQPLYGNARGAAIMTVCLIALFGCLWVSKKIMNLNV
ncbi:type II secretion system F family protein [Gorillibacterium timonense]|uniref:type II secretion system F family protein n=1 Tax=Gorillibacterium timonense TaxID=1689269 RepID=UPI00071C9819|nr:type II secretion system F family protein [Gorillibacterium timonense]